MKSVLIIGLGSFGRELARKMDEMGNEVMVIDKEESALKQLENQPLQAQIADCTSPEVIHSLGVRNFDLCFVSVGGNLQSSLEITALLKENGARNVIATADRAIQEKFLLMIGADRVIRPERDIARRAAMQYGNRGMLDYIELTQQEAISELLVPRKWIGHSVRELQVRSKFHVNIVGISQGEHIQPLTDPDIVFVEGAKLWVAGDKEDIEAVLDKK